MRSRRIPRANLACRTHLTTFAITSEDDLTLWKRSCPYVRGETMKGWVKGKRHLPEEIVTKLRQLDVLAAQDPTIEAPGCTIARDTLSDSCARAGSPRDLHEWLQKAPARPRPDVLTHGQ